MGKHRYFELNEFIVSSTAKKKNISNVPTFEVVAHLDELVEKILDPLRAAYGMPITVTSGYRCPELNRAVGGVTNSAHLYGWAADLVVGGSLDRFKYFIVEWLRATGARFDQLLLESDRKGNKWVHIGLYNALGQQRGQIKVIDL